MKKKLRNINWKSVVTSVLVSALLLAAVSGLTSLFGRDTKTIPASAFSVGALDENGKYLESELSIFTEDLIECQGLCIEPDFKTEGTYQVFYYGSSKNFIGATEIMDAKDGVYSKGNTFELAQYCRIMITPAVPTDDDGKEVEDYKIHWYNVHSIASEYTITVDREQKFQLKNLLVSDADMANKWFKVEDGVFTPVAKDGFCSSKMIDVTGMKEITIDNNGGHGVEAYFFVFDNGDEYCAVTEFILGGTDSLLTLDVEDYMHGLYICYKTGQEPLVVQTA